MTTRPSIHIVPRGPLATARHYIRDLVYGASDGVVTTFAVVSGVAGGALSPTAVLVVGAANLAADGLCCPMSPNSTPAAPWPGRWA